MNDQGPNLNSKFECLFSSESPPVTIFLLHGISVSDSSSPTRWVPPCQLKHGFDNWNTPISLPFKTSLQSSIDVIAENITHSLTQSGWGELFHLKMVLARPRDLGTLRHVHHRVVKPSYIQQQNCYSIRCVRNLLSLSI